MNISEANAVVVVLHELHELRQDLTHAGEIDAAFRDQPRVSEAAELLATRAAKALNVSPAHVWPRL